MKVKEKQHSFEEIQESAPSNWFDENFTPIDNSEQVDKVLKDLAAFTRTPEGRKIKGDLRKRLHDFAIGKAYKPDGSTYVDVMGTYTIGTSMKNHTDLVKRGKRYRGEQIYAESLIHGLNQALKEKGFVRRDDSNYQDRASALLALEADSVSSKGPFDGGGEDVAIKTVDTVLSNAHGVPEMPADIRPYVESGILRRVDEYKGHVDATYKANFAGYVDHMQSRQIADTMRGYPFFTAGNAPLQKHHYEASLLMFSHINEFPYTKDKYTDYVKKFTVDQFIQDVMVWLNSNGYKMSDWYNAWHTIIVPISRDQGSPFLTGWKGEELYITERGNRKYRLVTPISAFAQAWLIMATVDIINVAPATEGRIGLQTPDLNEKRMTEFIQRSEELNRVLISTDFSAYDSTLPSWMMQAVTSAYALLYNDEVVKDAMHMAGVVASQKLMILPTSKNDRNKPYPKYKRWFIPWIKGDRDFAIDKTAKGIKHSTLRKSILETKEEFDYIATAFYIYGRYLPSGIIVTNLLGSDCTLLMSREIVPQILSVQRYGKTIDERAEEEDMVRFNSIGSGDDCAQEDEKEYFDSHGYSVILDEFEAAYAKLGMIVNASKQLQIKINGYPLVDFLQKVKTQHNGDSHIDSYLKFMRQAPTIPYKERYSRLYLILQWVIPWGKLDSALCEENLDFAASVFSHAGNYFHEQAKKINYKPPVPIQYWASRSKLFWDSKYTPLESPYLGMEQFLGLVKQYGQSTLASIVRYSMMKTEVPVADLVSDFAGELETRAPHRGELARILFESLNVDEQEKIGYVKDDSQSGTGYVSLIPEFLRLWESKTGVAVNSVALDEPLVGAEVQHQDADESSEDDVPIGVDEQMD